MAARDSRSVVQGIKDGFLAEDSFEWEGGRGTIHCILLILLSLRVLAPCIVAKQTRPSCCWTSGSRLGLCNELYCAPVAIASKRCR